MPVNLTPSGLPSCVFFSYAAFERRWGKTAIAVASNKDRKSKDPDYGAVQDAFDYAVNEVENAFRGGVYVIPFDFTPYLGVIPPIVARWAMIIAFADLYMGRGMQDNVKQTSKLSRLAGQVYDDMSQYKTGYRLLNAKTGADMTPTVVTTTDVLLDTNRVRVLDGAPIFG